MINWRVRVTTSPALFIIERRGPVLGTILRGMATAIYRETKQLTDDQLQTFNKGKVKINISCIPES